MEMRGEVRVCADVRATLGEGPVWAAGEGAVYFVDIKAPALLCYDARSGALERKLMPAQIGALALRSSGGLIGAFEDGVFAIGRDLTRGERIALPEPVQAGNRLNDGKCDGAGRFWFGSMDDGESRLTGRLYRLDPGGTVSCMDDGYCITNGPAFSPDGRTLYHTDTLQRVIYAFDLHEDGSLSGKRVLISLSAQDGYPDGLTVDSEGCIWNCHWGGSRITRFAPDGRPLGVLRFPAPNITSCAFGGPDLKTLYVTSARKGLDDAALVAAPLSGALFAVELDVAGLPTCTYGG